MLELAGMEKPFPSRVNRSGMQIKFEKFTKRAFNSLSSHNLFILLTNNISTWTCRAEIKDHDLRSRARRFSPIGHGVRVTLSINNYLSLHLFSVKNGMIEVLRKHFISRIKIEQKL